MSDPLLDLMDMGFNIITIIAKNKLIVTTLLSLIFIGCLAVTVKTFIEGDMLRFGILGVGTMLYFQASVVSLSGG